MSNDKCKKNAKIVGYLEKRGKMTITGRWKKWWCVLEGHLLLYYRSQTDYEKLSPCCGSLNVALARSIQPNIGCQIYILTYSQLVILRARSKEKHQQWFHALASVLPPNNNRQSIGDNFSANFVELHRKSEKRKKDKSLKARRRRHLKDIPTSHLFTSTERSNDDTTIQLDSVHARLSQTETDLQSNSETLSEIRNSNNMLDQLKKFYSRNKKNLAHRFAAVVDESTKSNQIRKYSSYHNITTTLIESGSIRKKSLSCDCIVPESSYTEPNTSRKPRVNDIDEESFPYSDANLQIITDNPEPDGVTTTTQTSEKSAKKKRDRIHKNTISRRSFNFFKKFLTKGKSKEDSKNNEQAITQHCDENLIISKNLVSLVHIEQNTLCETIDNKTSSQNTFSTISEMNESVRIEECDSWTMIRGASQINDQQLFVPQLPVKMKINSPRFSLRKGDLNSIVSEPRSEDASSIKLDKNVELDYLMIRLNNLVSMTHFPDLFQDPAVNEDPDYDIPRPHLSLISQLEADIPENDTGKESPKDSRKRSESFRHERSLSMEMAPDSLEMPWLSNKSCDINYFSNDYQFCLEYNNDTANDDLFQDSLIPVKHVP